MDAPAPSARERLGRSLAGKYCLESVLGAGGTAVVYRATNKEGAPVAVKILHEYLSSSAEVCARFLREIYVANLLDHPSTVRVYDDGITEDGTLFFVLELLEGQTLEDRRTDAGGTLPLAETLDIADRILEVLELAHAKGVVHRDVKPSNVFLTRDGGLKVLDFGIARLVDAASSATVTKTGQTMGTPAFMPPEQALSKPREIDAQSDLWAVGATIFTLLSGEHVHAAESASEHLVKAATANARSLTSVIRGVPSNVEAFVTKALSFAKSERFKDAREMRAALAAVKSDPGRLVGTDTTPAPSRTTASNAPTVLTRPSTPPSAGMTVSRPPPASGHGSRRRLRTWWAATAAALLVAALLAGHAIRLASDAPAVAAVRATRPPPPPVAELGSAEAPLVPATTTAAREAPVAAASTPPPKPASPRPTPQRGAPHAASPKSATVRVAPTAPRAPAAPAPKSTADLYRPF